ncbi:MAG TPA: 23S rRNA (uracil(1939)-C(5))-methyltransferase RlmD [Candidatus Eisenbacteria bacterium]|nr:23S rRNA (uracil(1939)-C(5))-methyltransferase RlmD [Candidatus Eisenbacteria bacterium]
MDTIPRSTPPEPPRPPGRPFKKGETVELKVEDLAFGGRGITRVDSFVLFVDGALPGDRVTAVVTKRKPHYAEARATAILEPSPLRVPPACAHVGVCGGCRFQDLAYSEQLLHKERQVADCLKHLGGLDATMRPIVPAERTFGYRNKMEYSFGRDPGGALTLGLHRRGLFDRPFDLERCHIASETSSALVAFVREKARAAGLPSYDTRRREGLLRFLVVREGMRTGQVMVNLVASDEHPLFDGWAGEIRARFPSVRSVLLNTTRRLSSVASGDVERVLSGTDRIEETLEGLTFEISSASFFQTNTEQAERLLETALEGLALSGSERVLDLYSGTGTFTLPIAKRAREVVGVESNEAAVRDAERNAARNGIANVRFVTGEAERHDPDGFTADAILVDPPRVGLHAHAVKRLVQSGAPRLVYVSCNPSTLGRDLALLCDERYRLEWVRPVDMFPHTAHIECVAALSRRS